jgi:hypothetical protein
MIGMDGSTATLFETVQQRVAQARLRVAALDASDDVKTAALKRLNRLERASRYDLSIASREVERFHADLDAGEVPLYD